MDKTIIKGITWNHSRGFVPMVATAQRFEERNSEIEIKWDKRSLQEFADGDLSELSQQYDLLVIDHPWAGFAHEHGILEPLNDLLGNDYLQDQASNSVGKSYESYHFGNQQWALPIDAATPVAAYRDDLLQKNDLQAPQTWDDVLDLARLGKVIMPGIPLDSLMNFYMLCVTQSDQLFQSEDTVIDTGTGILALQQLRELASYQTEEIYSWNPIKVYEALTKSDHWVYCPFAYGYSNYSRKGYANRKLVFTDLVTMGAYGILRSTLGGTGLALSSRSGHKELAAQYIKFVGSPECQKNLFFENGGQPGHRSAWLDEHTNKNALGFFKNTLETLDSAYLRPRYSGYLYFQDRAGDPIQAYLKGGGSEKAVLGQLDEIYRESKKQS